MFWNIQSVLFYGVLQMPPNAIVSSMAHLFAGCD
jgi:hypothetical protein